MLPWVTSKIAATETMTVWNRETPPAMMKVDLSRSSSPVIGIPLGKEVKCWGQFCFSFFCNVCLFSDCWWFVAINQARQQTLVSRTFMIVMIVIYFLHSDFCVLLGSWKDDNAIFKIAFQWSDGHWVVLIFLFANNHSSCSRLFLNIFFILRNKDRTYWHPRWSFLVFIWYSSEVCFSSKLRQTRKSLLMRKAWTSSGN